MLLSYAWWSREKSVISTYNSSERAVSQAKDHATNLSLCGVLTPVVPLLESGVRTNTPLQICEMPIELMGTKSHGPFPNRRGFI